MNFYQQKGVYILYDDNLNPVYAGQAGLTRRNTNGGQVIGDRLGAHSRGIYRNGWSLFSWFGFLDTERFPLKQASEARRMNPDWVLPQAIPAAPDAALNVLLASFEAILIEGFAPRFNARGGDLANSVLVDQYEPMVALHSDARRGAPAPCNADEGRGQAAAPYRTTPTISRIPPRRRQENARGGP